MYLFNRQIRFGPGKTREQMEWALEQTERANQITDLQVSLYMEVYSPQVGAVGWSTFVPDLAALEAAGDKLTADDSFVAATDKGAAMTVGGASDSLAQVIYGEPDPSRQIEYVTVVRAVCATGNVARGLEAGVELAQRAEKIMSTPSLFLADVTGNFGGVAWASGYENVQALEAAQQSLASDESWAKFVDKATTGVYAEEPSLTTQTIYRRLA
jgi:hypothetical protein